MTAEALVAFVTALVVLATAVIGLMVRLQREVQEVHVLVNSRMREALVRITQLHNALLDAGVAIPHNNRDDSP